MTSLNSVVSVGEGTDFIFGIITIVGGKLIMTFYVIVF